MDLLGGHNFLRAHWVVNGRKFGFQPSFVFHHVISNKVRHVTCSKAVYNGHECPGTEAVGQSANSFNDNGWLNPESFHCICYYIVTK